MSDDSTRALAEARRKLLALGPGDRLDLILDAARPRELVRALPAHELYLTFVVGGLDRALPLLRHASRHQLDFILDIDGWTGDALDPERTGRWLDAFAKADQGLVARWLAEGDEATVVLAVSRLVHVYKLDESTSEDRWPPDRAIPTLDSVYFVEGREGIPDEALAALWDGLRLLRASNRNAYEAILEQVLWIVPAEQEDEASTRRWSRLAERGFPEPDEAMEVRAPGDMADPARRESAVARMLRDAGPRRDATADGAESGTPRHRADDERDAPRPALPAASVEGSRFVRAAARLDDGAFGTLTHGLARLANRFAVADGGDLGEPSTHARSLQTAAQAVALGLDVILASTDEHPDDEDALAAALLATVPIAEIARVGTGAVEERAARARRLALTGWLSRVHLARERLDAEFDEIVAGLLLPRPRLHAGGIEREFESAADLASADADLAAIEALGDYLEETLGAGGEEMRELAALDSAGRETDAVTWTQVVLTALANYALCQPQRPAPLRPADAADATDALLSTRANPAEPGTVLHSLAREAGLGPVAWLLERRLGEDAPALRAAIAPDPRFVRSLLLA